MAGGEPQVIVDGLRSHVRRARSPAQAAPLIRDGDRDDQDERDGEDRRQPRPSVPPRGPRRCRGRRPLGGQSPLERERCRVLRESSLQQLGQGRLDLLLPGAAGTAAEMSLDGPAQGRSKPAPLVLEEMTSNLRAPHRGYLT